MADFPARKDSDAHFGAENFIRKAKGGNITMRMKDGSHVIDIEVDVDANKAELFRGRAQDPASTVSGTKTGEQTKTETPK